VALIRQLRNTQQPQQGAQIDWANPLTRGLAFAYVPGVPWDLVGKFGGAQISGGATRQGGSLLVSGAASNGLNLGSGAVLGSLQNSSVVVVAGVTTANGKALYCERAASGNDIYKLEIAGAFGSAQFTYRNDGGTLLQTNTAAAGAVDGAQRLFAITKNGTAHAVYCGPIGTTSTAPTLSATGTIGSGSTAFSNAGIVRSVGYDVADSSANASGHMDLVLGYARTLQPDEIASLRANPWQIFKAPNRRLWTVAAATGTPTGVNGSLNVTLGAISLAATGTAPIGGAAAITLGTLVDSASGTTTAAGSVAAILGQLTAGGLGTVTAFGALEVTLGSLALTAAGSAPAAGNLSSTLAPLTLAASGGVQASAGLTAALAPLTLVATGTAPNPQVQQPSEATGQLSRSLGSLTLAATGTAPAGGQASITLGVLAASAAGAAPVAGQAGITLGALSLQAYGGVPVTGSGQAMLGELALTATAGMFVFTRSEARTYTVQPENRQYDIEPEDRTYWIEP
jgi:hypothetical protein